MTKVGTRIEVEWTSTVSVGGGGGGGSYGVFFPSSAPGNMKAYLTLSPTYNENEINIIQNYMV